ncbi:MAG: hypothetical protein P1U63_03785 [Coxiellaceae bacterium]|nr:hypothetical protein [Coxiellaceae bacterium]
MRSYRINVVAMAHRHCRYWVTAGSYVKWAQAIRSCENITTLKAEVDRQIANFNGRITGWWHRKSFPYYHVLQQISADLQHEKAYQDRTKLLHQDQLCQDEVSSLVDYYLTRVDGASYGLTELTSEKFDFLFMPNERVFFSFSGGWVTEQLLRAVELPDLTINPALKATISDYLYLLPQARLSSTVKDVLYNDTYINKLFSRIEAQLATGSLLSKSKLYLEVIKNLDRKELADELVLRLSQLGLALMQRLGDDALSDVDRSNVEVWEGEVDFDRVQTMTVHAYIVGIAEGVVFAKDYDRSMGGGISSLCARRVILKNMEAYVDSHAIRDAGKTLWQELQQQMRLDTEKNIDEIKAVPILRAGRVFSIRGGWNCHAISITLCCIAGITYLAIANRGEGCGEEPGIHLFKVNNPTFLARNGVIKKLHRKTDNQAYMLDVDKEGDGIGKDLQLERMYYFRQSYQRGPRCAPLSVNKEIQMRMMFFRAAEMAGRLAVAGRRSVLAVDDFKAAYQYAKPLYKDFHHFSRAHSADHLERLARINEQQMRTSFARGLVGRANTQLFSHVEGYAYGKWTASGDFDRCEKLLAVVDRRKRWRASLLARKPTAGAGVEYSGDSAERRMTS